MPEGHRNADQEDPSQCFLGADQVLIRLDSISTQLSNLAHGQKSLDINMRKLQQDLGGLVPRSGPATPMSSGYRERVSSDYGIPSSRQQRVDRFKGQATLTVPPMSSNGEALSSMAMVPVRSGSATDDVMSERHFGAKEWQLSVETPPPTPASPNMGRLRQSGERRISLENRPKAHPGEQAEDPEAVSEVGEAGEILGWWPRKELVERRGSSLVRMTLSAPQLSKSSTHALSAVGGYRLQPMHPDSWKRAIFDCMSILVLVYDSVLIPYQLAWFIPFEGWMATMSWVTCGFWCMDFLSGFCTGYQTKDGPVMEFNRIARRYLLTYFFPNLLVLVADFTANMVESTSDGQSQYSSYIKLSRFMKLNRVLRLSPLLRTGKVAQLSDLVVTKMRQWGLDKQFSFMMRVCKLVFYIMWVNHVGCCVWHASGTSAALLWYDENSPTDAGRGFQYVLNFYWSASSMIAGESVMTPTTTREVVITTFFVVFGFIFSSVVISSLLTTVMEYQDSNKERSDKLKTLRQFLYQHDVVAALSVPIQKQVSDRLGSLKRLSEKDVSALSLLSPVMRSELWYSIYGPSVADCAFIRTCDVLYEGFLKEVCYHAMEHVAHGPGVRIFEPALEALGAHFVYWGMLEYLPVSSQPKPGSRGFTRTFGGTAAESNLGNEIDDGALQVAQPVRRGRWISSMALWVHWLHRGWMEACTPCELLTVKADGFVKVLSSHPEMRRITRDYCGAVSESLKRELPGELDDIHCGADHESLLSAIPLPTRVELSWASMQVLERREWLGRMFQQDGYQELAAEVEKGECDLVLENNEQVYRLVSVTALRLERGEDGFLLMQIAKCIKGKTVVSCTFPGTKMQVGEHSTDAVHRLLEKKLRPFNDKVTLHGRTVDTQEKISKKYGVSSRYMRTLFSAMIDTSAVEGTISIGRTRNSVRSDLSTLNFSEHDITADYEAFAFQHEMQENSTMFIYAWISPKDALDLTSPIGDRRVQKWVDELKLEALEERSLNNSGPSESRTSLPESMTGPLVL